MWCVPPKASAESVCDMEDVLSVYHRPYDPARPVVCLDETSKQIIGGAREPLPPAPGRVERYDSAYVRNGVANLFLAFEPPAGWRHVEVTETRTRRDWAHFVRDLVDGRYREAEVVVPVMDRLNTHSKASLYEAFPPAEAERVASRPGFHHTPKRAGRLDMAEMGRSVLPRQCLARRPPEEGRLASEVKAWEGERGRIGVRLEWSFRVADARRKLAHLYPQDPQR